MVKQVEFRGLDEFIEANQERLIIVDFYTEWCGPCKDQSLALKELEKTNGLNGNIVVIKVDVDEDGARADAMNIASIPTIMFYKNGKTLSFKNGKEKTDRLIGLHTTKELLKIVKKFL